MSKERHPVVQAMIDVVEEVLDPEAAALKKIKKVSDTNSPVFTLSPEMAMTLKLLQMGFKPKDLGLNTKEDE